MKDLIKKILKEENDFDWAEDTEPISKNIITKKLNNLEHAALVSTETSLVKVIYNLALEESELDKMVDTLDTYISRVYDNGEQEGMRLGHQEGYHEGYNSGQYEESLNMEDEKEYEYNRGYEEGYDDGVIETKVDLKKECSKNIEIVYNQAFEEGRAYEAELDAEEYEKRQSGFDLRDYEN